MGYDTHSYGTGQANINGNYIYGNTNTNSYTTARYGIVGYKEEKEYYTEYNRWIDMAAYRLQRKDKKTGTPLWKLSLQSEGPSNDLRQVLPYIIYPLRDTLCTNTYGYAKFIVYDFSAWVELGLRDEKISVIRKD